jgi:type III pantothenate kinase
MKALFDLGNSRLKWALSENGIRNSGFVESSDPLFLSGYLDTALGKIQAPGQAWISSVSGDATTQELVSWLRRAWSIDAHIIKASADAYGVINSYVQPETLGSDRWAALIAIKHRYMQPATIIDCGTATTIDFLDGNRFYGGVILPGLQLSRSSLVSNTARLQFKDSETISSFATSTSAGIQSGTLLGLVGAIEHIVKQQQQERGKSSNLYLTGGSADAIKPYLVLASEVIDDLVLQGIEVIAESKA